jgi:hypothetical protein
MDTNSVLAKMARRDATSKQYSTYLCKWEIFALQNNVNVWNPDISHILEFFVTLLNQGCGYSVINTARSALHESKQFHL